MKKDIILSGVGGQGILTIAAIIDYAAMLGGLHIKQAEVHGMSQRGGAVQSHLRISDSEIFSDLISFASADLILSLEPMETLRYMPFLANEGIVITAIKPFVNISDYPDEKKLLNDLRELDNKCFLVDVDKLAKNAGNARAGNVVMIGAAHKRLGIEKELLKEGIKALFSAKGNDVVEQNLTAFNLGAKVTSELAS